MRSEWDDGDLLLTWARAMGEHGDYWRQALINPLVLSDAGRGVSGGCCARRARASFEVVRAGSRSGEWTLHQRAMIESCQREVTIWLRSRRTYERAFRDAGLFIRRCEPLFFHREHALAPPDQKDDASRRPVFWCWLLSARPGRDLAPQAVSWPAGSDAAALRDSVSPGRYGSVAKVGPRFPQAGAAVEEWRAPRGGMAIAPLHPGRWAMKTCGDLMTYDLRAIASDATALEAAQMMRDNSIGFLPVSDRASGRLVAVVTDRDLATRLCAADLRASETFVLEVATGGPVCCYEGTELPLAEEAMGYYQVSRLVVVDPEGQPIGVVSLTDILMNDRGGRAVRTARNVLKRESESPQPAVDRIVLTPGDGQPPPRPAEEVIPSAEDLYHNSGPVSSREDYILGGRETRAIKEFPR